MTNWSDGVDSKIFLAGAALSMLIWRSGRRTWKELSLEVSMMSLWERALARPISVSGVWFQIRS